MLNPEELYLEHKEELDSLKEFMQDAEILYLIFSIEDNEIVPEVECNTQQEYDEFFQLNRGIFYSMHISGEIKVIESNALFEWGFSVN